MSQILRDAEYSPAALATPGTSPAFADLIAPVGERAFFDTYWEQKPLFAPATDRQRFRDLLSTAEVNRFLALYGRTHQLGVRLSRHREGRTELVDLSSEYGLVDIDRVFAAYLEGFTININDVE